MKTSRLLVPLVLIAAMAGAYWLSRPSAVASAGWQGYVEADTIRVAPTLAGRLTALAVARGDAVATGAPLFAQDDGEDRAARNQAAATLDQARAALANLQAPARDTEIAQARANLAADRAVQIRAERDRDRAEHLVLTAATSRQILDQARADADSAAARVAADRARLDQLTDPTGRAQEIAAQQAAQAAAEAALAGAQWRLDQRQGRAPEAGRITETYALPGETLAGGAPVVALLAPAHTFVRFFVPEPELSALALGRPVNLACDGCAPVAATVSYIAPSAEYTPPVIFSDATRGKLVWMVEARTSLELAATLKPGQPVTVTAAPAP